MLPLHYLGKMGQVGLEPTKFPSDYDNPYGITCAPVVSVVIAVVSDAKPPVSGPWWMQITFVGVGFYSNVDCDKRPFASSSSFSLMSSAS